MTFPGVPFVIGGGAVNPVETFRGVAYLGAHGGEGVVRGSDCKVSPLATPADGVRVGPGMVVVINSKPSAYGEAYVDRNPEDHLVAITPTSASGGRNDLIYYRVADPQYADEPAPASVENGPYGRVEVASGVSASCSSVAQAVAEGVLPAGRVGLALARVALPPSTQTVTAGMITDLRVLQAPRSYRVPLVQTAATEQTMDNQSFVAFPAAATWTDVTVPSWATHAIIRGDVIGLGLPAGSGPAVGNARVQLGTVATPGVPYYYSSSEPAQRTSLQALGQVAVPTSMRGTRQTVTMQAQRTSGTRGLRTDTSSVAMVEVEFVERIS